MKLYMDAGKLGYENVLSLNLRTVNMYNNNKQR